MSRSEWEEKRVHDICRERALHRQKKWESISFTQRRLHSKVLQRSLICRLIKPSTSKLKTIVFERTFKTTLCRGILPVSGIRHQNTSDVIFCITTRPKLLINDCVNMVKDKWRNSYCPFWFSIVCSWCAFMLSFQGASVLNIITDLYLSTSTISSNSSVNTIKHN